MSQEQNNNKQDENVNVNVNEKQVSEQGFFKKVITSITDLEKYPSLTAEKMTNTLGYIALLLIIVTLVTGVCYAIMLYNKANSALEYFKENIPELSYQDGNLQVGENQPITIDIEDEIVQKIIIDTSEITEETYNQYEKEIKNNSTAILFLKDRMIIKLTGRDELIKYNYKEFEEIYSIETFDKETLVNNFSGTNLVMMAVGIFVIYFMYMFMQNFIATILYAITIACAGYVTALLLHLRIRFDAIIKISIHALTLSTILFGVYSVINTFTGFVISYFDVMYITVAYIYVIATLFIIKSEMLKKQMELTKILEEQARIAMEKQAEEERKEKEKQEQKERERRKKRDEQKKKKQEEKENKGNSNNGEEPTPEVTFENKQGQNGQGMFS